MKVFERILVAFFFVAGLAACTTPSRPAPTLPSLATPTSTSMPALTPVESALAPGNATAAPSTETIVSRPATFETVDGATISGNLYGSGDTAIIFSVMGNCKQGWTELAQASAAQGFLALTYQWRGCKTDPNNETLLKKFLDDTRGAINFVHGQGATRIILVGASLGGVASAKLAVESQAIGLAAVAAPDAISQWGFHVAAADVAADIPKLFITAENDSVVPASATRALHDLAAEPKEWETYPGTAHGTDLFDTDSGPALTQRLLAFFAQISAQPTPSASADKLSYEVADGVLVEHPAGWTPARADTGVVDFAPWLGSNPSYSVRVEVYNRPLAERMLADPHTWVGNEGGYEIHWEQPIAIDDATGLEFVWGVRRDGQWESLPQLMAVYYSERYRLDIRLTVFADAESVELAEANGWADVIASRYGDFEQMAHSIRIHAQP